MDWPWPRVVQPFSLSPGPSRRQLQWRGHQLLRPPNESSFPSFPSLFLPSLPSLSPSLPLSLIPPTSFSSRSKKGRIKSDSDFPSLSLFHRHFRIVAASFQRHRFNSSLHGSDRGVKTLTPLCSHTNNFDFSPHHIVRSSHQYRQDGQVSCFFSSSIPYIVSGASLIASVSCRGSFSSALMPWVPPPRNPR